MNDPFFPFSYFFSLLFGEVQELAEDDPYIIAIIVGSALYLIALGIDVKCKSKKP